VLLDWGRWLSVAPSRDQADDHDETENARGDDDVSSSCGAHVRRPFG
jgi:hypothetical protein